MNKVILSGNLCRDIEVKTTTNGKAFTMNAVAVSRDRKEQDGTYKSDFINFVAWEQSALYLQNYAHKGDRVELVGRWQVRDYEKDGEKKTINEVVVESITCFSKPKEEPTKTEELKKQSDILPDDLPF